NPSISAHVAQVEKGNNTKDDIDDQESGNEYYNVNNYRGKTRGKGKAKNRGKAPAISNNGKTQCQICGKSNHEAAICWYRYEPPNPKPAGRGYNA
ncbi:retrovirus-related pol polyprotein from transposon TNT 1-94, partial [Trifolium medium]|nr:retrovirus-related pol polyprotein from transposon TNT 1-94 [Trifolium medium]